MTTTTAVKERPILMSGPMVQALRSSRKTQTRRIVKPQPLEGCGVTWCSYSGTGWAFERSNGACSCRPVRCPYGRPGDRLWVREALKEDLGCAMYAVDMTPVFTDGDATEWRWRRSHLPSIHMPHWASRILLEITEVRVERLQDISEADAEAEGCFFTDYGRRCFHQGFGDVATCPAPSEHHQQRDGWMWGPTTSHEQCLGSARFAYGNLWNSINGPGSWDLDPFVWAITFRVLEGGAA